MKFVNRVSELAALEKRYKTENPEFMIIYGKRRAGKTELIKKFFKDKPHIYFLADKRSDLDQLKELAEKTGEYFNDSFILRNGFSDWISVFEYFREKLKTKDEKNEKLIFVVDEFPYLVNSNNAIPSLFQKGWDEYLKELNIFLILCGSSISMMEKETLSHKSPLYGRRTGQFMIEPMDFKKMRQYFPGLDLEKAVMFYSILGGTPEYWKHFPPGMEVIENINENVIRKDAFLYNEIEFILREELREPKNYFSIIRSISFGKTKLNEIVMDTGLERGTVSKYLETLESLKLIKREIPVTEKHPHKSRKGIYIIEDNFFNFWFRFVYPNRGYVEEGRAEYVLEEKIKPHLNTFAGHGFEGICREILIEMDIAGKLPFMGGEIGRWWEKDTEIDIISKKESSSEVLFCECKWKDNVSFDVLNKLKKKTELVEWEKHKRKEYFMLFAKSFNPEFKKYLEDNNILCVDLEYIQEFITLIYKFILL